jgi:small-conductance mechanosensitive channel
MIASFVPVFRLGPQHNVEIFGVRLLGVNAANGRKLLFTALFFLVMWLVSKALRAIAHTNYDGKTAHKLTFWTRQGISLTTFVLSLLGFMSIWFDNPARLATALGLVAAGLAFALQKVITSFAGYFVILRGKTFNVGDRITMGGVRGDVIALNFIQTVIMEMGLPPSGDQPSTSWVAARQYTGRIVTVTNAKIFDDPVYNFTREFPYIWEELHIPISYKDDRNAAERILLAAADRETVPISEIAEPAIHALEQRFLIQPAQLKPQVFFRLTDNWIELSVRFLCKDHDIRGVKDRMSREIIDNLQKANIGIASGTYEIVGIPSINVEMRSPVGTSASPTS